MKAKNDTTPTIIFRKEPKTDELPPMGQPYAVVSKRKKLYEIRTLTPAGMMISGISVDEDTATTTSYIKFQPVGKSDESGEDAVPVPVTVASLTQEWTGLGVEAKLNDITEKSLPLLSHEFFCRDAIEDVFNIHQPVKGKILCIITGASGVGKSTLADILCDQYGLKAASSYTDRPPRFEGETGHVFLSSVEFDKLGTLLAPTTFAGYRYGLPETVVDESDILLLEPEGVRDVLHKYSGGKSIVVVGLTLCDDMRYKRMIARGDTADVVENRIKKDQERFANVNDLCDIVFENTDIIKLEKLAEILFHIITGNDAKNAEAVENAAVWVRNVPCEKYSRGCIGHIDSFLSSIDDYIISLDGKDLDIEAERKDFIVLY